MPAPEGRFITRGQAPELFAVLDGLRKKLRGPPIHHVLITGDFNAGIVQVPRLGVAGWPANYLLLGLPLMQALSGQHIEAVLAHEYGHLAGAHGRFASWIYRVRLAWAQLAATLEETAQWSALLFRRFFAWYAPYFAAYTFVLARANEYDADRCSADIVGADIAADALVSVAVKGRHLEVCHSHRGAGWYGGRDPYLPAYPAGWPQPCRGEFRPRENNA